jgi:fluoroacetyl-CoA thioesterase
VRPIPVGFEGRLAVLVTEEMTVDFGELGRIHPVYATYWLARHLEEAGRKVILPFLEPGEEGIGSAVSVRHLAPALPGARLEVVVEHVETRGNRVLVHGSATAEDGELIGEGQTEQTILPKHVIERRIAAAPGSGRPGRQRDSS